MYTQALNSGGGLAQRLNQHFYFEAIRVWDLSAMPFYQSGAGCFFADSGLPSDPPIEGIIFRVFFWNYWIMCLQYTDIYGILVV